MISIRIGYSTPDELYNIRKAAHYLFEVAFTSFDLDMIEYTYDDDEAKKILTDTDITEVINGNCEVITDYQENNKKYIVIYGDTKEEIEQKLSIIYGKFYARYMSNALKKLYDKGIIDIHFSDGDFLFSLTEKGKSIDIDEK